jgi:hypothetical protein
MVSDATNERGSHMARPTNDLSDDQLRQGIKNGEYGDRDALIAGEILKRRHEERARSGHYRLGAIGAVVAAFWLWLTVRLRLRKKILS